MKKWLFALAGLAALAGPAYWIGVGKGYAQGRPASGTGPLEGQAPSELHAFPPSSDPVGSFVPATSPRPNAGPAVPAYAGGSAPLIHQGGAAPPAPDPTREYLVTKDQGPWMICVHSYTGPEAPAMAVQLVQELRNRYKLPAYIFNYGAEERHKEMERVIQIIQAQRKYLQDQGITPDPKTPIRVRHRKSFDEQCAVLVGGYADMESARRALDGIKKLPPPDAKRFNLQEMFIIDPQGHGQKTPVNPFTHGFVARNPALPKEDRPADQDKLDIAVLRKLNAGEPLSLLQCPKKYTLAITQLQTPTVVQPRSASGSFLESLGFGSKTTSHEDAAAQNAHNFAEVLRKMRLEAYVLHARFSSIVTVGGYDSPDDPRLKLDQERLNNFLESLHLQQYVRLFPQPRPMEVPH
jgi:hypothetical protein